MGTRRVARRVVVESRMAGAGLVYYMGRWVVVESRFPTMILEDYSGSDGRGWCVGVGGWWWKVGFRPLSSRISTFKRFADFAISNSQQRFLRIFGFQALCRFCKFAFSAWISVYFRLSSALRVLQIPNSHCCGEPSSV